MNTVKTELQVKRKNFKIAWTGQITTMPRKSNFVFLEKPPPKVGCFRKIAETFHATLESGINVALDLLIF